MFTTDSLTQQNIREVYFTAAPKKNLFIHTGLSVNAELTFYLAKAMPYTLPVQYIFHFLFSTQYL
jgi:hypothetical protein